MTWVRAIAATAGGIWLGGMILIAIVAQTTFSEMRHTGIAQPNAVAGRVMARNFARFDTVQIACAGVLLAGQALLLTIDRRSARVWARLALTVAACALLGYSVGVLTPGIVDLQSSVAESDAAAKAVFDRFHATAVRIAKANLLIVFVVSLDLAVDRRRPESRA